MATKDEKEEEEEDVMLKQKPTKRKREGLGRVTVTATATAFATATAAMTARSRATVVASLDRKGESQSMNRKQCTSDMLMRPLTHEEQMVVIDATQEKGPPADIIASHDCDSVKRGSMQTLRPGYWLNDEVINYFHKNCLAERDKKMCAREPGRRRSHFFNTFFVQTMFDETNKDPKLRGIYNYKNVKRWSKKVPGKDIFNLKYIFCPINHNNKHWTSAVIFMEDKRIQYYDSLAESDDSDGGEDDDYYDEATTPRYERTEKTVNTVKKKERGGIKKRLCKRKGCKNSKIKGSKLCDFHKKQLCKRKGCFQLADQGGVCVAHSQLEGLLEYVKDEYRAKKGNELDVTKWELVSSAKDTPRQTNGEFVFLGGRLRLAFLGVLCRILLSNILFLNLGLDCGVFTCMFGDFISRDCQPLFNQDHIEQCRDRIALSIMTNCAIDDSDSQSAVATTTS